MRSTVDIVVPIAIRNMRILRASTAIRDLARVVLYSVSSMFRSHTSRRALATAVLWSLFAFITGCAKVAPYQRGTLAHPTMTTEDIGTALDAHVRDVAEGANGGLGGGGGGCGCN